MRGRRPRTARRQPKAHTYRYYRVSDVPKGARLAIDGTEAVVEERAVNRDHAGVTRVTLVLDNGTHLTRREFVRVCVVDDA